MCPARFVQPAALLLDDLRRRPGEELLVVELALQLVALLADLAELPVEPGALLVELDDAREREDDRRLVQHHLHRAGRHLAI